ncbi:PASTA domain-containing protein [Xylanimonas ulmi]|nr:PASTA domain-containing protein [Xylanibacterium ulmi]
MRTEVPDLLNETLPAAQALLYTHGISNVEGGEGIAAEFADFTSVVGQYPAPGTRLLRRSPVVLEVELVDVRVPVLEGRSLDLAIGLLRGAGLVPNVAGARIPVVEDGDGVGIPASFEDEQEVRQAVAGLGIVEDADLTGAAFEIAAERADGSWLVDSDVATGTLTAGSQVDLTAILPVTVVPEVSQATYRNATAAIEAAGLSAHRQRFVFDGELPSGFELSTSNTSERETAQWTVSNPSFRAGRVVEKGSTVAFDLEWPAATVPDVRGLPADEAHAKMVTAGFTSGLSSTRSGVVYSTSREPGERLPAGFHVGVDVRHEVTLRVHGDSARGSVTWFAPNEWSIQQATSEPLPWSQTWMRSSRPARHERGSVTAQRGSAGAGSISCEILVNGEIVATNTSTGPFAVVSC